MDNIFKRKFDISKTDNDRKLVFGWASMAKNAGGDIIEDFQEDIIDISDLETAAYDFVLNYRSGGEMHRRGGIAVLIESMVFTQDKLAALGLSNLPEAWWIGFKIIDESVWEKIKNGEYCMFSIEGKAVREQI